jgi:OmpA-OmpF porin, OOP family
MVAAALRALAIGPALFLLSGCCCFVPAEAETVVVVVPSRHDGHVGAVVATRGDRQTLLNTAYASVRMAKSGEVREAPLKARQMEEFKKTFAAASEALPPKALTYTLYFEYGSDDLTAESNRTLDTILSEAAVRKAAEIIVVGHSDSPGTAEANMALSMRRAEHMRDLLVARGAPLELIAITGVGDTDPEVQTDIREERNRRVEITIR